MVLAVAVWLSVEAWSIVAPALEEGWLGWGVAGKVFLPLVLLLALSVWLWQRR